MLKIFAVIAVTAQLSFTQVYPEYKDKGWIYLHNEIFFVYPKTPLSEESIFNNGDIIAARSSTQLNILVRFSFVNGSGIGVLNVVQFFPDRNNNNSENDELYFKIGESAAVVVSLFQEDKINSILTVKFEEWNPETGKATLRISQEEL